ncbi:hypothetical protein P5V15_004747 [Pogonomyrmex californicus]
MFHFEGGLQLLSRFSERPRSINLDNVLFSTDIDNESIIEIVGASSTGKTLLLCQFIARCILPARYKDIEISGCNVHVVLIDTYGHVEMSKIAELMTPVIHNAYQVAGVELSDEVVDHVIHKSLENLTVISCCNNEQFQLTLHMLEDELLSNEKIALLAIDNILAYYWQERRIKGILSMDNYTKDLLKIIRIQTSQFHMITIYTKWDGPVSKYQSHSNLLQGTGINYRLHLYKNPVTHEFVCHVQSTDDIKRICYTISDSGIKWIQ